MSQRIFLRDVLPLLAWMAVIFVLSTGAGSSGHTNSWVDGLLARLFPRWSARLPWAERDAIHFYLRKAAHVTEYSVLGVLAVRAFRHRLPSRAALFLGAWIFASLYAATDEFHQIFVAGRTPKVTDVLIDSAGAALGIGLASLRGGRTRRDGEGVHGAAVEP